MKKVLLFLATTLLMVGCIGKYGRGGQNACQFVKEQMPELRNDIKSVEVVEEDSLLCDKWLAYDQVVFARAGYEFTTGKMSRKKYEEVIDKYAGILQDINNSWMYGIVVNDSLKRLEKYDSHWRKVYKVCVTMKSGIKKDIRVMMEEDGLTPAIAEGPFAERLQEYNKKIVDATLNIYQY